MQRERERAGQYLSLDLCILGDLVDDGLHAEDVV